MLEDKRQIETREKILEVANRLFMERGYDNTSIQDIINELEGLTKGAIYYHFKSKFEIFEASINFIEKFDYLENVTGNNNLEIMRSIIVQSIRHDNFLAILSSGPIILKSPSMIGDAYLKIISYLDSFTKDVVNGIEEGSVETEYPKEISEFFLLYFIFHIGINLKGMSKKEFLRKMRFIKYVFDGLGVPVINDEILKESENLFNIVNKK